MANYAEYLEKLVHNSAENGDYFHRRAHSTEQTPFTRVFQSDNHVTAESPEAMRIRRLAQGHNKFLQLWI